MENMKADISIKFIDSKTAENFFVSLQPETLNALTDRSSVSIKRENDIIHLYINAKDITAFRATLNSYLIWTRVLFSISSLFKI
ncbi:MAG: KEOPS complex subunit Pcc1 [Promethearchaeota archaeon]